MVGSRGLSGQRSKKGVTEHKKKKKTGANDVLERGMGDVTGITTNDMRSGIDSLRGSVIPMKFLLATIEKTDSMQGDRSPILRWVIIVPDASFSSMLLTPDSSSEPAITDSPQWSSKAAQPRTWATDKIFQSMSNILQIQY